MNVAAGLSLKPPVGSRKEKEAASLLCCDSYWAVKTCSQPLHLLQRTLLDKIGHGEDGREGGSRWQDLPGSPWVPQRFSRR